MVNVSYVWTFDVGASSWICLSSGHVITQPLYPRDIILAKSSTSGTVGRLFVYSDNGYGSGQTYDIQQYDLPSTDPLTSGTWTSNSPSTTVSNYLGDKLLVPAVTGGNIPAGLATFPGAVSGDDDIFARFWDTSDLYPTNVVMMRWQNGVGWDEVSGFDVPADSYEDNTYPPLIFKNVGGTLYYGYDYAGISGIGKMMVWRFASNAVTTSCWVDTGFPSTDTTSSGGDSGFVRIFQFDATTGASGAIYVPTYDYSLVSSAVPSCVLNEMQYSAGDGSACVITHAVSGDIYNIGGISGESTTHIVFTMWDNATYGRGKSKGK